MAKVLVVDGSETFRQLMRVLLSPYAGCVLPASGRREACEQIEAHGDVSLVLSDVCLHDGNAFEILSFVRARAGDAPAVLLLSARPSDDEAKRAAQMGALGYLAKPTTLHEIRRVCLRRAPIPRRPPLRAKSPSFGQALLLDASGGREAPLCFEIRDLSVSGAFLVTQGPIPVGTEIQLALVLGEETLEVNARVVRIQEPSWANVAGVGVRFDALSEAARRALEARVESAGRAD